MVHYASRRGFFSMRKLWDVQHLERDGGQKGNAMLEHRKKARDYLKATNKPEFLEIVYRAKVTPRQREIIYKRFLDGYSITKLSGELNYSRETIRDEMAAVYDLIYKYLFTA